MKIYCPYKCAHWGDWIANFWVAEYIKKHLPDVEIHIDENGTGGYKIHTVDSSISEWADELIDSTEPYETSKYDYMLCTHHRHNAHVHYTEPYKKMYFDCSGLVLKFVLENWYPSFCATKTLIKQFEKLNLPDEYNVVHYSYCISTKRNKNSFDDFLKLYEWIWKDNKTISTGLIPMPECVDLAKIPGLLKLYVMLKAKKIYGSHSGFTMIASMWRKREHSYLIDAKILEHGPPIAAYTNVKLTGDLKPVYYYLENHPPSDYYNWCQTDGQLAQGLYPNFKITKDESPSDYIPKKVYTNIENCPLPYNYNIEYKEIND